MGRGSVQLIRGTATYDISLGECYLSDPETEKALTAYKALMAAGDTTGERASNIYPKSDTISASTQDQQSGSKPRKHGTRYEVTLDPNS